MASNVDVTIPANGSSLASAPIRGNWVTLKAEIEALQAAQGTASYTADNTVGRAIVAGDLKNLIIYNSASNANFSIPNDDTLGITGLANTSFELYMKGNGVPLIVAGAGVTLVTWAGYPTPTIGTTQTAHRVGANTWAVK